MSPSIKVTSGPFPSATGVPSLTRLTQGCVLWLLCTWVCYNSDKLLVISAVITQLILQQRLLKAVVLFILTDPKAEHLWGWKEQTCHGQSAPLQQQHHEQAGSGREVCHTHQQCLMLLCLLWCLPCFIFPGFWFFFPDILQSGSRY